MIDFSKSNARIVSNENFYYDLCTIIDQSETILTLEYLRMDTISTMRRKYKIPDAFEDGLLCVKGKANDVLMDYIRKKKQLSALDMSIKTIALDNNDAVYNTLQNKKRELLREIKTKEEEFYIIAYETAPEWDYIKRDEHEVNDQLMKLAHQIAEMIIHKRRLDEYKGLKLKKYSQLKQLYDRSYSSANDYVRRLIDTEKRLQSIYSDVKISYKLKYESFENGSYDGLIRTLGKIRALCDSLVIGEHTITIPIGFYRVNPQLKNSYKWENNEGYSIEIYPGKNPNIDRLERMGEKVNTIKTNSGNNLRYYTTYFLEPYQNRAMGKPYYLGEAIINDTYYSLDVTKKTLGNEDIKEVEDSVHNIECLVYSGGF